MINGAKIDKDDLIYVANLLKTATNKDELARKSKAVQGKS